MHSEKIIYKNIVYIFVYVFNLRCCRHQPSMINICVWVYLASKSNCVYSVGNFFYIFIILIKYTITCINSQKTMKMQICYKDIYKPLISYHINY